MRGFAKYVAPILVLAGCGDNLAEAPSCVASFAGNFAERSMSREGCAVLTRGDKIVTLGLAVPSSKLDAPLAIEIDLGPEPVAATYSSASVGRWSVRGTSGNKACLFVGGNDLARRGSFVLDLHAIEVDAGTVAGVVMLDLPVLQTPFQICGANLTETVEVEF